MGNIHVLSPDLQNKIAAGEVVDRPASVVKELVENSIDAGAKKILIEIEEGGRKLIKVTDDGLGMDKEDLKKSIMRYATSKIKKTEDLFNLMTLGFRGEALSSISSVSDCEVTSRKKENIAGNKLNSSTGEIEETAAQEGTKICIKNLFRKVPARLKYLKNENTEFKHIVRVLQNFALIYPNNGFKLLHNKRCVFDLPEKQTLRERIMILLGIDAEKYMKKINFSVSVMELNGFTGVPEIARTTRYNQYIFVNRRAVKSSLIASAVNEAYKTLLLPGKYPFFVLSLLITSDLVDVNVHPRKEEIRFLNSNQVYIFIKEAVEKTLEGLEGDYKTGFYVRSSPNLGERNYMQNNVFQDKKNISHAMEFTREIGSSVQNASLFVLRAEERKSIEKSKNYRIVGQIRRCYIIVETENGIEIFDQHAMHERIRYRQIKKNLDRSSPFAQKMLFPEEIKIAFDELVSLGAGRNILEKLGFEIEHKKENVIQVKAVPSMVAEKGIADTVKGLVDDLTSLSPADLKSFDKIKDVASKYLACRGAVMDGDILTIEEMERMYENWLLCDKNIACPHGRPVRKKFKVEEIKRWFLR